MLWAENRVCLSEPNEMISDRKTNFALPKICNNMPLYYTLSWGIPLSVWKSKLACKQQ